MIPIVIHVSDEQAHRLTQHAFDTGYQTVEEYLQALIEADLQDAANEQPDGVQASLARGFDDALSGRTLSEDDFWHRLHSGPKIQAAHHRDRHA
jgi:hypothetical protein